MKVLYSFLCLVCLISASSGFYSGINLPWVSCGNDYGGTFDSDTFNQRFSDYASAGANIARVWIHFDGDKRYSYFDSNGHFTDLNDQYKEDFGNMLQIAENHDIQILVSLWSFECVDVDNCREMIVDQSKSTSYVENGLKPLLEVAKKYTDSVMAFEIFNEPEWMLDGTKKHKIGLEETQIFVTSCIDAIHEAGLKATVGSASLKWSCNIDGEGCLGDYWGNTGIDFYQIHYYDWMIGYGQKFDPYQMHADSWKLDKPILVGESPGNTFKSLAGELSVAESYYLANANGYIGNLAWSDLGFDGVGTWKTIEPALNCPSDWDSCKPAEGLFEIIWKWFGF